jgi:membrane protein implicated in regulation of membrane protease activity
MCHLLLLLPFVMLPVFWLWPASIAVPLYATTAIVSGVVYWYALKSARMPKLNGAEAMLGARGRVVDYRERCVTLLFHGELWAADTDGEALAIGDEAVVVGIEGLRLRVRKATA